jgi:hypothetical protein
MAGFAAIRLREFSELNQYIFSAVRLSWHVFSESGFSKGQLMGWSAAELQAKK